MADLNAVPSTDQPFSWTSFLRTYLAENAAFIAMIVLSLIGISYTDLSVDRSYWYWQSMVPIFGIICIITGWVHTHDSNSRWELIRTQILHWGAFFTATYLVFLPVMQRTLDNHTTGLTLLLMVAFSTFLAGVYINWRFCVVGVFLGIAVMGAAFFRQITLMMLLVAIALLVISILWARYVLGNRPHRHPEPPPVDRP